MNDRICVHFHGICIISHKKIKMAKNPQVMDYRDEHKNVSLWRQLIAGLSSQGDPPHAKAHEK